LQEVQEMGRHFKMQTVCQKSLVDRTGSVSIPMRIFGFSAVKPSGPATVRTQICYLYPRSYQKILQKFLDLEF